MDRILILGCSGAGKSTLAGQLSQILDMPIIHLDQEYWQPGWKPTPDDLWFQRVATLIQQNRWIMDGNYGSTLDMRLKRADGIIVMDYPRWLCLWRVMKRICRHKGHTRPDMAPECVERWDWEFIRYVWAFKKRGRIRNYQLIEEQGMMGKIVVLKNPRDARAFVKEVLDKGRIEI
jgi:adenylate kinase family enzyme